MMRDRIVVMVTMVVGVFVLVSLGGALLLALNDKEAESVWRPLFDLVAIMTGAVAGYIGGVEVERQRQRKNGKGQE